LRQTVTILHQSGHHAPALELAPRGIADWLCLAAAPTFGVMALLTAVVGEAPQTMVCSASHGASPLSGMALMYALMSAFHAAPWLGLVTRRRNGARRA
jgi:hypothetical protein